MPEPNETYAKIQSIRVKNLEQQVHLLRAELQRVRECLLPQKDLYRLTTLAEKLKELNDILKDLKNHYDAENSKQEQCEYNEDIFQHYSTEQNKKPIKDEILNERKYPKKDFKQLPSSPQMFVGNPVESTKTIENNNGFLNRDNQFDNEMTMKNDDTDRARPETFKTCKELMADIRSPGSILGNYLVKLQDFRADPELRRQRLQRKQKEKEAVAAAAATKNKSTESAVISNEPHLQETTTSLQKEIVENVQNTTPFVTKFISENQFDNDTETSAEPNDSSSRDSDLALDLLLVRQNLRDIVYDVVRDIDRDNIALTVVLETDQLYHVSVSKTSNGESLACFFSTEDAIQEAKYQNLFKEFLTLFVVNAENSMEQKDRILGHSFEFIKLDV